MEKEKIFVSAYACEPGLGSEIGVGWHWVLEMSKSFELWVLTRESNRKSIEPWIEAHRNKFESVGSIHFLYYDWPEWARFWKKGLHGVRIYYNLWQFSINKIVRKTMTENDIEIFHHLTYGNVFWRVSKSGQHKKFIWGPVGGAETIPAEYSRHYAGKSRLIEATRRFMAALLPINIGFRKRCRYADLILCKTEYTLEHIPEKFRKKAILFTDVATDTLALTEKPCQTSAYSLKNPSQSGRRLITVGRLDAWRGFDLVLEALSQVIRKGDGTDCRLTIVGEGPDRPRLEAMLERLNLGGCVTMVGEVPMQKYKQLMSESDVVVNAALKEGAVTVAFDSMAMGKPLICIDTTGYTRYFKDAGALVIPRSETRETTIADISDAILQLCGRDGDELRTSLGQKARDAAKNFTWERRGVEIEYAIEDVLD